VKAWDLVRNWVLSYIGNFLGCAACAYFLVYLAAPDPSDFATVSTGLFPEFPVAGALVFRDICLLVA
jgi:hypothetical protein